MKKYELLIDINDKCKGNCYAYYKCTETVCKAHNDENAVAMQNYNCRCRNQWRKENEVHSEENAQN